MSLLSLWISRVANSSKLLRYDHLNLFVDDPLKFNRTVEEFVQSLPKQ